MIEIINGNPTTLETVNLALLCQKIDKESKKYSPLLYQLMKCCERFKSNMALMSSSLSDVLAVMTSLSNTCTSGGSSGLTLDIGKFLSEEVIKQSELLESLEIFDEQFSDILKNTKEKTKIFKEKKILLKKKHSKNIKLKEKDIRNFNKIERNNKNKKKLEEIEKDCQVANLLLNCKNLEDREKLSLVELAGIERIMFNEYLMVFKQFLLLQRELFSTQKINCSIQSLDQLLQNDTIALDAVSGVLSVSRNKSTIENEVVNQGTNSPAGFGEKLSVSEWSASSDRTSAMSESSAESVESEENVSLRKSGQRFSTVRRSASPMRVRDSVTRPVPCKPPVILPGQGLTSSSGRRENIKNCSQSEDYEDDFEVSFYMNNMAALNGEYFSFDRIKDEVI